MIEAELSALPDSVDVLVVGGGITGAGVARELARLPVSSLLVEAADFASGTSSMSSKLVHGGLRYLKTGEWHLTLESVRERQQLLREAPGLVERQGFVMPLYFGRKPSRATMQLGLGIYDAMARQRNAHFVGDARTLQLVPGLSNSGLHGAMCYDDARTDDARLVLRVLQAARNGGVRLRNYTRVQSLLREQGRVCGAILEDSLTGQAREIRCRMLINAAGVRADQWTGQAPKLRPLRGSHLLFPVWRFPLAQAVSWLHPDDGRPVFAYPWEGATLYGTTDLDQGQENDFGSLRMNAEEARYLIAGLQPIFPSLELKLADAMSQYTGVRPIVDEGAGDPSAASRESACWSEPGLVGITGGKLTTFRVAARQVLGMAAQQWADLQPAASVAIFDEELPTDMAQRRLHGRLGGQLSAYRKQIDPEEQTDLPTAPYQWGELRWALRHEAVRTLSDLMMRRTRLGLVTAAGGQRYLQRIAQICQQELAWSDEQWQAEREAYLARWRSLHDPLAAEGA